MQFTLCKADSDFHFILALGDNSMDAISQARDAGVVLDEQNRIDEDLPCIGCGYLLRSMSPDGDCPECGKAVSQTTQIQRLRRYPESWLKQMRLGLGCIQITCIMFAAAILLFALNLQQNMRMAATASLTVVDVLFVCSLFPGMAGFLLLTQPYQSGESKFSARRLARFMTATSIIAFVACLLIPKLMDHLGMFETLGIITTWFAIGACAMLWHASSIARMIPHQGMSNFSRWLSLATLLFLVLCGVYSGYLSTSLNMTKAPISMRTLLYTVGPMIGAIVLVVICGVYLILLKWYRNRFAEALNQNQSAEPPMQTA
ncbi:MAG: hypothetical protein CMJ19_00410 [Phycisphaeraceae bacterium]|nr:hypothetical protein [Phycisphaeraceae bacterium]